MNGGNMADGKHTSATTTRVLKALKIFGGVQAITILCSVVRTKLAALWLGPVGVGLMTIYNSTMDLIAQTSQLNIQQSAVRELSQCRTDAPRAARLTAAVRRLALMLALPAMLALILCSPLISRWAFGDTSHTAAFVVLSPWLVLSAVAGIEMAVMRANDKLKNLANASRYAALTSVAVAVPLFYYLRLKAVIPVLLIYPAFNCIYAFIFRDRSVPRVPLPLGRVWKESRGVLSLGVYMTVSSFVTLLASNVFVIYLNKQYSGETVGIYQAGYTLVNTYVGMIFTAIAMEYYPRLSSVVRSSLRTAVVVSHEVKMALLVLMPVAVLFIACSGLIVKILYTSRFEAALPYIVIGATGVFFRAVSWCLAFVILARGDGKVYVFTELASALVFVALYIPLFNRFGFAGIGVGYVAWYAIYFAITYAVCRMRYGLRFRSGIPALVCLSLAVALAALLIYYFAGAYYTLLLLLPVAFFVKRSI